MDQRCLKQKQNTQVQGLNHLTQSWQGLMHNPMLKNWLITCVNFKVSSQQSKETNGKLDKNCILYPEFQFY